MTAKYQGMGVEVNYPENWRSIEEVRDGETVSVSIESPESAFFTISQFPLVDEPYELVEQAMEAMKLEYDSVEIELIDQEVEGIEVESIELRFYYLDLLIVSRMVAFNRMDRTYMVQQQAENRDYDRLEPVFQAMLVSLMRSTLTDEAEL